MPGLILNWLTLHARHGLLTLAVLALGLTGAVLSRPALPATVALAATAPAAPALPEQTTIWPRTVLRLWFLVPQLLPADDR